MMMMMMMMMMTMMMMMIRFNWLLLNLFTAFLATWCISLFGATIEQMVVLAFLMPIVASMGGNAGMQTLAVTVRTLATNDLTKNNFNQNILKEFNIGVLNGIIFGRFQAGDEGVAADCAHAVEWVWV